MLSDTSYNYSAGSRSLHSGRDSLRASTPARPAELHPCKRLRSPPLHPAGATWARRARAQHPCHGQEKRGRDRATRAVIGSLCISRLEIAPPANPDFTIWLCFMLWNSFRRDHPELLISMSRTEFSGSDSRYLF
jgi:hypothetical protein